MSEGYEFRLKATTGYGESISVESKGNMPEDKDKLTKTIVGAMGRCFLDDNAPKTTDWLGAMSSAKWPPDPFLGAMALLYQYWGEANHLVDAIAMVVNVDRIIAGGDGRVNPYKAMEIDCQLPEWVDSSSDVIDWMSSVYISISNSEYGCDDDDAGTALQFYFDHWFKAGIKGVKVVIARNCNVLQEDINRVAACAGSDVKAVSLLTCRSILSYYSLEMLFASFLGYSLGMLYNNGDPNRIWPDHVATSSTTGLKCAYSDAVTLARTVFGRYPYV